MNHMRHTRLSYEPAAGIQANKDVHAAISAWFLGPQAENFHIWEEIFVGVLRDHAYARKSYHPEDQVSLALACYFLLHDSCSSHPQAFITEKIQSSSVFQEHVDSLKTMVKDLSDLMNDYSIPFYSPRYNGHMCMEMSLPSIVGWVTTILFNPNNVRYTL